MHRNRLNERAFQDQHHKLPLIADATNKQHQQQHSHRETVQDYSAKKREMLFVQYAVQIKQNEIEKMEIKTRQEELELVEREKRLEEEIVKFDAFLKDNDRICVEALKRAEQETKIRLEKSSEHKKLTQQALALNSELIKNEDQLADLRKYRQFLLKLTPVEWLNDHGILDDGSEEAILHETTALYFTRPEQLAEELSRLEESSLQLILAFQEGEDTLDELKQQLAETKQQATTELNQIKAEIDFFKVELEREEARALRIENSINRISELKSNETKGISLQALNSALKEAYRNCFGEDTNISTITMLTAIENKLERLFEALESMPPEKVELAEKQRDKERRQRLREERIEAQKKMQEERARKALERALTGNKMAKKEIDRKELYKPRFIVKAEKQQGKSSTNGKKSRVLIHR